MPRPPAPTRPEPDRPGAPAPVEGVTKFTAVHRHEPLVLRTHGDTCAALIAWRDLLAHSNLIGQDPARYGGAAFGNVSARVGPLGDVPRGARRFLITGTQTGGRAELAAADFCVVERWDLRANQVWSRGPIAPSSESMTHGAIYDLAPHVRAVLHAHAPRIWRRRDALRLPTTAADVEYGTPEMAREAARLYRETALSETRVLCMAGHEDGVISFGRDVVEAGAALLATLARAIEREAAARLAAPG